MRLIREALCATASTLLPALAALAAGAGLAPVGSAAAAESATWRLAPAQAPPPPPGVAEAPYGVPVGTVGDISFWAPNRGLLITGGTSLVPAGVYAYDGVSWHELSTVCGGAQGRIVWAGPDEFWTIANQRAGQQQSDSHLDETEYPALSLCRFANGQVLGSYAVPVGEPESWRKMTAGACYTPTDCWFGGGSGTEPQTGAFHLHWNGSTVTAVYEPEDHGIVSMTPFNGQIDEAVQLSSSDAWLSESEHKHPAAVHAIAAEGAEPLFSDMDIYSPLLEHALPDEYEDGKVAPEALGGFELARNAPLGEPATQMWALAVPQSPPSGSKPASLTIMRDELRDGEESWSQLEPVPGGGGPLAGARILGGGEPGQGEALSDAIAPEPGGEDAWLSLNTGSSTTVAQVEAGTCEEAANKKQLPCGRIVQEDSLPQADERVGPRGKAGPIVCPASHDCWMATFAEESHAAGWIFHLSDGAAEEPDTDPFFDGQDGVITVRPVDSGIPPYYTGFGEDDSLANQVVVPPPPVEQVPVKRAKRGKPRPLLKHVKSRLVHHRELVITFVLMAKAHVQLVARDGRVVVAKTPRRTLRPGRHVLSLALSPDHWPTKLQFEAKPINGKGSAGSGAAGGSQSSESDAIET